MSELGFHVTFRLVDSRVIAPDAAAQRALARSVLRVARPFELLAFGCADTHGHIELFGDQPVAAEATRRILCGISRTLSLPVSFARPWLEPVSDQWHLANTFRYVLRQDARHGFAHDRFHDASNLPDLLGLRMAGTWTATHVRGRLPRVDRAALLELLGAPDLDTRPVVLDRLADAAAAAVGVPALDGRAAEVVDARAAAVQVAARQAGPGRIAALLGCTPRHVRRLLAREVDPALVRAVEGQLRLRGGGVAVGADVGAGLHGDGG